MSRCSGIRRSPFVLIASSLAALYGLPAGVRADEFLVFHDPLNRFSLTYPNRWRETEPSHAETALKLEYTPQDSWASLNIIVQHSPKLAGMHPAHYAQTLLAGSNYVENMKEGGLTVTLLDSGLTALASQSAVFYDSLAVHSSLNTKLTVRQLQVLTLRQGFVFTLTFVADPEDWDHMRDEFELIAIGFLFTGDLARDQIGNTDPPPAAFRGSPSATPPAQQDEFTILAERTGGVLCACFLLGVAILVLLRFSMRAGVIDANEIAILRREKRKGWVAVKSLMGLIVLSSLYVEGLPVGDFLGYILPRFLGLLLRAFIVAYPLVWLFFPPMRKRIPKRGVEKREHH